MPNLYLGSSGGGGGTPGALTAKHLAGLYHTSMLAPSSSIGTVAGTGYWNPIFVQPGKTYDRIAIHVQSGVASTTATLAIYTSDEDTGAPDALIADYGTVDTSTSGLKEIVISEIPVAAGAENGLIWGFALILGGTPTIQGWSGSQTGHPALGRTTLGTSQGIQVSGLSAAPDPAVVTTTDYTNGLRVGLRAA